MIPLPNPFTFELNSASLDSPSSRAETVVVAEPTRVSTAATDFFEISEPRAQTLPTETSAVTHSSPRSSDVTATFSEDCISDLVGTANRYAPEYFSDYARRRSMAIVSPNHGQREPQTFEPDFDALYDFIVPPEPPLCLRKPRPEFLRSLYAIAGLV